jgi:hypothetical protein
VTNFSEPGNEPFGSIKCGELLDQLISLSVPKVGRVPRSSTDVTHLPLQS